MDKILITGAAGFIAYHLLKRISQKKYQFILIDNYNRGKNDKYFSKLLKKLTKVKLLKNDLTKPFKIKDKKIKYVFHFAARLGVKNVISEPSKTLNDNLNMLVNTLDAVKKFNKKAKFIFFSTSEVYSPLIDLKVATFPLKENVNLIIKQSTKPRDSYYISKLVGEKIVQLSGLKYLCLRPHNIYGPRMGFSHVIPELVKKIEKNNVKKIKIFSPTHKRSFCHVDDAIDQILGLSFSKHVYNDTFNIGNSNEETKIFDLAKIIKKLLNSKKKLLKYTDTDGSPKRRVPDMKKNYKIFKKKRYINLESGVEKYINWYKQIK